MICAPSVPWHDMPRYIGRFTISDVYFFSLIPSSFLPSPQYVLSWSTAPCPSNCMVCHSVCVLVAPAHPPSPMDLSEAQRPTVTRFNSYVHLWWPSVSTTSQGSFKYAEMETQGPFSSPLSRHVSMRLMDPPDFLTSDLVYYPSPP